MNFYLQWLSSHLWTERSTHIRCWWCTSLGVREDATALLPRHVLVGKRAVVLEGREIYITNREFSAPFLLWANEGRRRGSLRTECIAYQIIYVARVDRGAPPLAPSSKRGGEEVGSSWRLNA